MDGRMGKEGTQGRSFIIQYEEKQIFFLIYGSNIWNLKEEQNTEKNNTLHYYKRKFT